jgi:hypothetical protein
MSDKKEDNLVLTLKSFGTATGKCVYWTDSSKKYGIGGNKIRRITKFKY